MSILVAAAFLVFVVLSVSLVHWSVATVPVRALFGVGLLGLLMVGCRPQVALALRKQRNTLLLIAGFAVLGAAVSALAHAPPTLVLRQLAEIHVQAAVNLLVAAAVLEICGARILVRIFIGVVGTSMALALLQAANLGPAWAVRDVLGPLLNAGGYGRGRAAGLSLNSILLATQSCLGIAMLYMHQRYSRSSDDLRIEPAVVLWCALALAVAVATGTRSPVIGILVFLTIYLARRLGVWALVAGLIVGAAAPLALALLAQWQGSGLRVLQTEDKSALGRWPLIVYGVRLFLANPLGYGFGFNPTEHWAEHWTALSHIRNAAVIRGLELHNYFLNTLNKYGIGQVFLLAFLFKLMWWQRAVLLGFIPYVVHAFFHNDGPLDTDYMIWFVVALTSMSGPLSAAADGARRRARSVAVAAPDQASAGP